MWIPFYYIYLAFNLQNWNEKKLIEKKLLKKAEAFAQQRGILQARQKKMVCFVKIVDSCNFLFYLI